MSFQTSHLVSRKLVRTGSSLEFIEINRNICSIQYNFHTRPNDSQNEEGSPSFDQGQIQSELSSSNSKRDGPAVERFDFIYMYTFNISMTRKMLIVYIHQFVFNVCCFLVSIVLDLLVFLRNQTWLQSLQSLSIMFWWMKTCINHLLWCIQTTKIQIKGNFPFGIIFDLHFEVLYHAIFCNWQYTIRFLMHFEQHFEQFEN